MAQLINDSHSVYVTGSMAIHPFGMGIQSLWEACINKSRAFQEGLLYISKDLTEKCRGEFNLFPQKPLVKEVIQNDLLIWSLYSLKKVINESQLPLSNRDGLIIATTTGLTRIWEQGLLSHFKNEPVTGLLYQPLGGFAGEINQQLGHCGPLQVVSSACSAGTQAIGLGRSWIKSGFVERCFILGAEQICNLTRSGFKSLSLVSGNDCVPFNEERSGICLSEAVGALVLEGKNRGKAVMTVEGYGSASDGYSMTSPKPDGSGPYNSMSAALQDANISSRQVDWIHAHGTGSLHNDRAEAAAIKKLEILSPVSSTKGIHGHSLAASGVLETILCEEAFLRQQILESSFSEPKHFTININDRSRPSQLDYIIKNTLGFGGINASLVLGRVSK